MTRFTGLKAIEIIETLQSNVEADGVKQEEAYRKYKELRAGDM